MNTIETRWIGVGTEPYMGLVFFEGGEEKARWLLRRDTETYAKVRAVLDEEIAKIIADADLDDD